MTSARVRDPIQPILRPILYLTPEFICLTMRCQFLRSSKVPSHAFTISKLAEAAGANVETIRYYQRRGILAEPPRVDGGFRAYDASHLRCLQFIRRALELGFSLDDASELYALSRSTERQRLREVAHLRAAEIRERIGHLSAMADALETLADTCSTTPPGAPCPIVAALTSPLHGEGAWGICATPAVASKGMAEAPPAPVVNGLGNQPRRVRSSR